MKKIRVNASRPYDVVIQEGFENIGKTIKSLCSAKKIAVVTDENVFPLYYEKLADELRDFSLFPLIVGAGEKYKTTESFLKIIDALAGNKFSREDLVIALGGGVVGDVAGFAAACYLRGIAYIQCPTTLLAAIDSSVGGKTGVNLSQGKNLLGAFYQPSLTFINTLCEETLSKRERTSGLGEGVKYSYISENIKVEELFQNRAEFIFKCVDFKAKIVEEDEKESGKRKILNFGHTVGHAVEAASGYALSHGECVIKGIDAIIDLSADFYGFSDEKKQRLKLPLKDFDRNIAFSAKEIAERICSDKKIRGGDIDVVLLKEIGQVEIVTMKLSEFKERLYAVMR